MAHNHNPDVTSLLSNRKAMEQMAGSADAQALASMLTKNHNQGELEKMAQRAMSGDTAAIQSLIQSITSNPEGAELLQRLGTAFGGR